MPAVSVSPTTSTEIVAADYNRTLVIITNTEASGGANCHIAFGAAATTNEAYIAPGGSLTIGDSRCKAAINGLSSTGTITIKYSKLSAGT